MRGSQVVGLGHYLPVTTVASHEIADGLGVSVEWIHSRTGIRSRHVAGPDESVVDMAAAAARRALADARVDVSAVEVVAVATSTGDRMPSTASQVAGRLGLHCAAFDVNAACAGFCHALAVADGLVRTGSAMTALVIGADVATAFVDWQDRNTACLFGDGAGAVVVTAGEAEGIAPVHWGSVGEHGGLVRLGARQAIRQEGQAVFRWAIGLGEMMRQACAAADIKPEQVRGFVPHQANLRIIDALVESLDAPDLVVARDVVDVGNTMAASIPVALSRMAARGELPAAEPVLLFGFGSGLAYAGQVLHIGR